jgi:hypothetical protein
VLHVRLLALAALLAVAAPCAGQAIPRDSYLGYLPLEVPALVHGTEASAAFRLFGDDSDPGYADVAPRDGVEDGRGRLLHGLAQRFGPVMVLNTTQAPMDFRFFAGEGEGFPLTVDTWSLIGQPPTLVRTDTVDLQSVVADPCTGDEIWNASGDCLLLDLIRRYDPDGPDYASLAPRSEAPGRRTYEVMFFDFPGDGPESWRREYENAFSLGMPGRLQDHVKVYVHPFINAVGTPVSGTQGYEFILQYYFFYPVNDGGNNHEGDWEHINVAIAPRSAVGRPLTAEEVGYILRDGAACGEDRGDPLVISYIDYYFHHQVYRMDYGRPNVYAPVDQWKDEARRLPAEHYGEKEVWKLIRHNAWWDEEETVVNTHPICYIGADNKGLDQLLAPPGGLNRDSHGTYPYPGLYKDIGPGGATEQINSALDVKEFWRRVDGDLGSDEAVRFVRGGTVPYTTPGRIEIVPDWERVLPLMREEPQLRRDWCWLVLPVRFGYPATESPFAGVIGHADTGNLSPFGPSCQPHWNRTGSEGGSHAYEPHAFETLFPLGLQDTFVNSWGYLNLTLPMVAALPPIDILWRLGAYPVRALLQRNDPVFYPADRIPSRFVGLTGGMRNLSFNEESAALLVNGDPGIELILLLALQEPDGIVKSIPTVSESKAWWWQVNFYMGRRLTTQNTLLHARNDMGFDLVGGSGAEHRIDGELNLWEYAGSFRYNLGTGSFRPYLKLGYGWTWYRVEQVALNGELLPVSEGEWINQPSFDSFGDLLPNSWHAGAGIELIAMGSIAPFPAGVDVSIVGEVDYTQCQLGLDDWVRVAGSGDLSNGLMEELNLERWTWSVGLNLGF